MMRRRRLNCKLIDLTDTADCPPRILFGLQTVQQACKDASDLGDILCQHFLGGIFAETLFEDATEVAWN